MKINRLTSVLLILSALICCRPVNVMAALTMGYFNGGPITSGEQSAGRLAAYLADYLDTGVTVIRTSGDLELLKALNSGRVDMAVLPDYLVLAAKNCKPLSTPISLDDRRNFKLYLLAGVNNPLKKIADLKGQGLARLTGEERSVDLFIRKLTGSRTRSYFKQIREADTTAEVVEMVREGKAGAACLSDSSLEIIKKLNPGLARQLKIIKDSPAYPNHPFMVNNTVNQEMGRKIFTVLANMRHDYAAAQILMRLGIKGFGPPITEVGAYPQFSQLAPERKKAQPPTEVSPKKVKQLVKPQEPEIKPDNKIGSPALSAGTTAAIPITKSGPREIIEQPKNEQPKTKIKKNISVAATGNVSAPAPGSGPGPEKLKPPELNTAGDFTADYDFFAGLTDSEPAAEAVKPEFIPENKLKILEAGGEVPPAVPAKNFSWLFLSLKIIFSLLLLSLAAYVYVFLRARLIGKTTIVLLQAAGKLHAVSCRIRKNILHVEKYFQADFESVPESGIEHILPEMLTDFGYKSDRAEIVTIISSAKAVFLQMTLPILKKEEIASALPWQIKEKKINFSPEDDKVEFFVRISDKKKNEMIIDTIIFSQNEYVQEWPALPETGARAINLECALFHAFCCALNNFTPQDIAFVYQLDDEQAIIFLLGGQEGVVSRRLFTSAGFEADDAEDTAIELWWPGFLSDMEQTFRYYHQQNGRPIVSLYLAGRGIPQVDDYSAELSRKLEIEVAGLNLLEQVILENVRPEEQGWIELMVGAVFPCAAKK